MTSRSSRRSTPRTSRGSARSSDALSEAGARIFHFDVGDGHFIPEITIGPIVLASISPLVRGWGARLDCHLMVREPERHFEAIAKAGGDSVTFHVEACDDAATGDRGCSLARTRRGCRAQPGDAGRGRGRCGRRRRPRALHVDSSRLLGAGVHARRARANRASCALASLRATRIQVDGGIHRRHARRCA